MQQGDFVYDTETGYYGHISSPIVLFPTFDEEDDIMHQICLVQYAQEPLSEYRQERARAIKKLEPAETDPFEQAKQCNRHGFHMPTSAFQKLSEDQKKQVWKWQIDRLHQEGITDDDIVSALPSIFDRILKKGEPDGHE